MPTKHRHNVVIGKKIHSKLKSLAEEEERSMSDIIREALLELFKRREAGVNRKEEYDPITDTFNRKSL